VLSRLLSEIPWYNNEYPRSAIAMLKPVTFHSCHATTVLAARHDATLAHTFQPERFINGKPTLKTLRAELWINRPPSDQTVAA
jgi:hypothetical protein